MSTPLAGDPCHLSDGPVGIVTMEQAIVHGHHIEVAIRERQALRVGHQHLRHKPMASGAFRSARDGGRREIDAGDLGATPRQVFGKHP